MLILCYQIILELSLIILIELSPGKEGNPVVSEFSRFISYLT